jgi:bifunctional DNA-binding transcriptional regulator/antitoxin component of YhaV-PrlF toxin-antitoxin module
MDVKTISPKGQVSLSAETRRNRGIDHRDRVVIEVNQGDVGVKPVADSLKQPSFSGKVHMQESERRRARRRSRVHARKR